MYLTKSKLAVILSKLKVFEVPELESEQYPTDSETAAEMLWNAYLNNDVEGKTIADFGAGTGILGIGCLLLGARFVYFLEKDEKAISILRENIKKTELEISNKLKYKILNEDISRFSKKVDVVVQNPPFGTKTKHADREFLLKAFSTADVVYSFHKVETKGFIEAISKDNGFRITHLYEFNLPIKAVHKFHKRRIRYIKVGCWRMERIY